MLNHLIILWTRTQTKLYQINMILRNQISLQGESCQKNVGNNTKSQTLYLINLLRKSRQVLADKLGKKSQELK
jgi:hypothetical protein